MNQLPDSPHNSISTIREVRGKVWKGQLIHDACVISDFPKHLTTPELASCYGIGGSLETIAKVRLVHINNTHTHTQTHTHTHTQQNPKVLEGYSELST